MDESNSQERRREPRAVWQCNALHSRMAKTESDISLLIVNWVTQCTHSSNLKTHARPAGGHGSIQGRARRSDTAGMAAWRGE